MVQHGEHVFAGERYKIPVSIPIFSPLTVLLSLETDSRLVGSLENSGLDSTISAISGHSFSVLKIMGFSVLEGDTRVELVLRGFADRY